MSVFEFDVTDSFSPYDNEVQGNKFPGLEFDDVLTDALFFDEEFGLSSFEILDEFLDFTESFVPSHDPYCIIREGFNLLEEFAAPAWVHLSAVNIIHSMRVSPVSFHWVSLDVLHGPDAFFEECIETMYLYSMTMVANLFFDTIYDDYFMDLDPPYQTFVDVARIMKLTVSDLSIFSCVSVQEYYFNNTCDERFFVFPLALRGFPCIASDRLVLRDPVLFAHTRSIDEALALTEACGSTWDGQETLSDAFVSFDENLLEKYYEHILSESIAFVMVNDAYSELLALADESVVLADTPTSFSTQYKILMESLIASEVSSLLFACFEEASDDFSVDHDTLCRQLYVDIVHDTCEALALTDFQIGVFEKVLESLVSYEVIEEQHERV